MKTWFTSDLHLGHEAVISFCNRHYRSAEEMDEDIIRRWNTTVSPKDRVYVLGDVSFHAPSRGVPLIQRLVGNKFLILGNHDKYSHAQYISAGFLGVSHEMVIPFKGKRLRLSHYPYAPRPEHQAVMPRYELRNLESRPPRVECETLLCGHVHTRWKTNGRMINVGVDLWHFQPVNEATIERILSLPVEPEFPYGS